MGKSKSTSTSAKTADKAPKLSGAEAKAAEKKLSSAKSVVVKAPDGSVIRTYSEEQHGEGFLDHAKEFAGKVEGRTVEAE